MHRVQAETALKPGDRLIVAGGLRVKLSQKVEGIGVGGIDLSHSLECIDGGIHLREIAIQNAEVVPRSGAARLAASRIEKNFPRVVKTLVVQQGDALVQTRRKKSGIGPRGTPEEF